MSSDSRIDRRIRHAPWLALPAWLIACEPGPWLPNPNGSASDQSGFSVSIDGNFAIVGVPRSDTVDSNGGKALIYSGSGSSWSLAQTIVASTPSYQADFGWSIGIAGERAIVGAFGDASIAPVAGGITGAAYLFERSAGVWTEVATVFGDSTVSDGFGISVAIDGDHALIGAPYAPPPFFTGAGAAWVYRRNPGGQWIEQAKLEASDGIDHIGFGYSVAIDGDVIVVGAERGVAANTVAGAAYVFRRQGNNWAEEAKLVANDPAYHDFFGAAVAVDGDVIVVGAKEDDPNGDGSGSAYVFRRNQATGVWSQQQKLVASDGNAGDNFGGSVSVDGPRMVIGAWLADGDTTTTGAAYLFRASLSDWQFGDKLFMPNGEYGDGFGTSVSVSSDCAIIGAVNDDMGGAEQIGAALMYCDLPGAAPPGFTFDIICCVEVPDPLGPVVITTRVVNEEQTARAGRRWIEWIDPAGTATVVAGPESITALPGEPHEERHVLPLETRSGGRLVLYWQDENGVRSAETTLPPTGQ
jgi:hypothetical protein